LRVKNESRKYTADISGLLPGTYLLKVLCNNQEFTGTFIKN
jgi:hypothetical protein